MIRIGETPSLYSTLAPLNFRTLTRLRNLSPDPLFPPLFTVNNKRNKGNV